jgi:hypothetical protein
MDNNVYNNKVVTLHTLAKEAIARKLGACDDEEEGKDKDKKSKKGPPMEEGEYDKKEMKEDKGEEKALPPFMK